MTVSLIVAVAENGVIGRQGGLPWQLSSDLKSFRRLTMGKPIVMGRKTFLSIGKPLPGRFNIVITRTPAPPADDLVMAASLNAALEVAARWLAAHGGDEIMVIGGAAIYAAALPLADRIYQTLVHGTPAGDVMFPALDAASWQTTSRTDLARSPGDTFAATLLVLERRPDGCLPPQRQD